MRTFGTWASIVGLGAGDRYLVVNPFFHTFGYKAGILACLMAGATVVPEPVFDADAVMERIEAERITVLPGPPTLYQTLLADPRRREHDLSSLRLGVTGAAVVPVELVEAMARRARLRDRPHRLRPDRVLRHGDDVPAQRPARDRRGTSGRAIPGLEVRAVADGQPVPTGRAGRDRRPRLHGHVGLLGQRGGDRRRDRRRRLAAHRRHRRHGRGGQRHHHRPGQGHVRGRRFNAYPAEIEAILRGHEGVAQVAVVGVPDERMGEVGCAYVVPDDAATGRPRASWAGDPGWSREAMANYKVPRGVVLIDALPVNASGKVLKRELRERHAAGADRVVTSASR